jgi:Fur family ferric uptake transcriptional regulator
MALRPLQPGDAPPPSAIAIPPRDDTPGSDFDPLCSVFRRALKREGLKYTPERAQVLDIILRFDGLFQAERLQEELRVAGFRVSKATVYRTLKLLEDSGIIQRVLFDPEQSHYQLAYGQRPDAVVVRTDTGNAEAVSLPELAPLIDRLCAQRGLRAEGVRLQVFARQA